MKRLTFVLGGARSGKSAYAEDRVTALAPPWIYIATARAYDDEMADRIARHRARRGDGWQTFEAPLDPATVFAEAAGRPVLIDCLTLWLGNLMLDGRDVTGATASLIETVLAHAAPVVVVSNEVGLGIVPENALARRFRDEAGRLHQAIAGVADDVILCVAGLPLVVKGRN